MIKALGAVAPALVCRDVYYGGAKHLLPVLELLLPGIDLVSSCNIACRLRAEIMSAERSIQDCKQNLVYL